jgi:hypothetical protein
VVLSAIRRPSLPSIISSCGRRRVGRVPTPAAAAGPPAVSERMAPTWRPLKRRARPKNGGPWWLIGEITSYDIVHLCKFKAFFIRLTTF